MAQIGRRLSLAAVLVDVPKGNRATSPGAGSSGDIGLRARQCGVWRSSSPW